MRPISMKVRPIPNPGLDTRGVLVATGHISVRSIADAIGCSSGSDRLRDGNMRPIPQGNDRSHAATDTKDSTIGRRVVFLRDSGDRSWRFREEIIHFDLIGDPSNASQMISTLRVLIRKGCRTLL